MASGVPRRSNPNAESRCHQEARQLDPRPDPLDERVVRRPAQRLVEVLDDRDRHPGGLETGQPLLRVDEQRRRGSGQDLVGMVVEGDDRRTGPAGVRLDHESLQQVEVPKMEAVEHADDDERRAQIPRERIDPGDDLHERRVRRASGSPRPAPG